MSQRFLKRVFYLIGFILVVNLGSQLFNLISEPEDKLLFIIMIVATTLLLSVIGFVFFLKKSSDKEV